MAVTVDAAADPLLMCGCSNKRMEKRWEQHLQFQM